MLNQNNKRWKNNRRQKQKKEQGQQRETVTNRVGISLPIITLSIRSINPLNTRACQSEL